MSYFVIHLSYLSYFSYFFYISKIFKIRICHWVWHSTSVKNWYYWKTSINKIWRDYNFPSEKTVWWVPYILLWKICLRCHQLLVAPCSSRFSSVLFGLYCYCSLCWIYASCFVVILVCMLSKSLNIDLWDLILTYGKYFLPLFLIPVCRWKWGIRLFFVYFDPFLFLLISLIPACFFRPHFSGPKSNLLCLKTDRLLNWPYVVLVILIFRKENYISYF